MSTSWLWSRRSHPKPSTSNNNTNNSTPPTSYPSSYNASPAATPQSSLGKSSGSSRSNPPRPAHLAPHTYSTPPTSQQSHLQKPHSSQRPSTATGASNVDASIFYDRSLASAYQQTVRPKPSQSRSNTTLSLGSLFTRGKPKRPSTSTGASHTHSAPARVDEPHGSVVISPSVQDAQSSPSTITSTSTRQRTNTISSAASSSNPPPLTPASAVDGDDIYLIGHAHARARANSATSGMSATVVAGQPDYSSTLEDEEFGLRQLSRKAAQLPSLLSVDEKQDPFAMNSGSFYSIGTPPPNGGPMFEYQSLQRPTAPLRPRKLSEGHAESSLARSNSIAGAISPKSSGLRQLASPTTSPPTTNAQLDHLRDPTSRRPSHLPFRARKTSAQGKDQLLPRPAPTSNTYLRPLSQEQMQMQMQYRLSTHSSGSTGSLNSSGTNLPLHYNLSNPHLSVSSNRSDPAVSPMNFRSNPSLASSSSPSSSSSHPLPQRPPPAVPQDISPASASPSPIAHPALLPDRSSGDIRTKRLRAALAVSVQELADDLGIGKPNPTRNSTIDLDLEVDVSALRNYGDERNSPRERRDVVVRREEPSRTISITEDGDGSGSYDVLMPPKPSFLGVNGPASSGGSTRTVSQYYGAPSFIGELASPAETFFASPYPSGMTTLPLNGLGGWRSSEDGSVNGILNSYMNDLLPSPPLPGGPSTAANASLPTSAQSPSPVSHGVSPLPAVNIDLTQPSAFHPSKQSLEHSSDGHSTLLEHFPSPPPSHPPTPAERRFPPSPPPLIIPSSFRARSGTLQPTSSSSAYQQRSSPGHSPHPLSGRSNSRSRSRPRALTNLPDANISTLSFSSEISFRHGMGGGRSSGVDDGDDDVAAEDSDLEGERNDFRLLRRLSRLESASRGSPASAPMSAVGGGSGSTVATHRAMPVASPPRSRKLLKEKERLPPPTSMPPTPRQQLPSHAHQHAISIRRPRTSSGVGLSPSPLTSPLREEANNHNGSSKLSLNGSVTTNSASSTAAPGRSPSLSGNTLPLPPRRRSSFNLTPAPPIPPLPPLRHCSSFNPPGSTVQNDTSSLAGSTTSSATPCPPAAVAPSSMGASCTSLTGHDASPSSTFAGTSRPGSSSGKRRLLHSSQSSRTPVAKPAGNAHHHHHHHPGSVVANGVSSGGSSVSVSGNRGHVHGPKGEVPGEYDWTKEKARYPQDDDARSLVTLNRFPSRFSEEESASMSWDEARSITSPTVETTTAASHHTAPSFKSHKSTAATTPRKKSGSPVRQDFKSMYIMPPSELLKAADGMGGCDDVFTKAKGPRSVDGHDLLRGSLEELMEMPSSAGHPEKTWLADLGVPVPSKLYHSSSMSALRDVAATPGASSSRAMSPPRGSTPSRPSTAGRTDLMGPQKSLGPTPQRRRPSTSHVPPTPSSIGSFSRNATPQRAAGAPLSPPPIRSRIPRSSISSSLRSLPLTANVSTHNPMNPLSPPPPRARALSGTDAMRAPPTDSSPRRASDSTAVEHSLHRTTTTRPPQQVKQQSSFGSMHTLKRNVSLLSSDGTIRRKKRQSMKNPSFLDIGFEEDFDDNGDGDLDGDSKWHDEEGEFSSRRSSFGGPNDDIDVRLPLESSFLDMSRGNSLDTTVEDALDYH